MQYITRSFTIWVLNSNFLENALQTSFKFEVSVDLVIIPKGSALPKEVRLLFGKQFQLILEYSQITYIVKNYLHDAPQSIHRGRKGPFDYFQLCFLLGRVKHLNITKYLRTEKQ